MDTTFLNFATSLIFLLPIDNVLTDCNTFEGDYSNISEDWFTISFVVSCDFSSVSMTSFSFSSSISTFSFSFFSTKSFFLQSYFIQTSLHIIFVPSKRACTSSVIICKLSEKLSFVILAHIFHSIKILL